MKTVLKMEWLRFVRNPVNLWTVSLLFVLLSLTALLSGLAASQVRERQAETQRAWLEARVSQHQSASQPAGVDDHGNPLRPGSDAMAASRKLPGVSVLQPRGGLVLGVQAFGVLPSEIKSGLRARYTDGRNSEPLENPLLQSLGALDLAAMTVLLLPLALIILAFGLVHEERERGIWRQVCALTARPWQLLAASLLVRAIAVLVAAWAATAIGFALDSGASWSAFLQWGLGLAVLSLSWAAIAGLFSLTRLSSAGSGAALVGTWLLVSFALPALLTTWAQSQHPGPSKLGLIVDLRQAQESMGAQRDTLLTQWYEQNPMHAQPEWQDGQPPRMLPFVTVGLAQDKLMRPLAQAFDQARAQRWASLHAWAWVAPGLPLLLQADQLAGADAERYAGFIEAVNQHEDHWRAFVMPKVMTAAPLSAQEVQALPAPLSWTGNAADRGGVASALLLPLALWLAFWFARRRSGKP